MGILRIKMPDIGEGIAEAELVEWHVAVDDAVQEDQVIASVMTDKATVEIPSSVHGTVVSLGGEVGSKMAIGSELVRLEVAGAGNVSEEEVVLEPVASEPVGAHAAVPADEAPKPEPKAEPVAQAAAKPAPAPAAKPASTGSTGAATAPRAEGEKPLASPAVRARARDAGIDLRQVQGTGPAGRISHADLDAVFERGARPGGGSAKRGLAADTSVKDIKVVGLRRMIADKMSTSKKHIPHITYVEEVDVTKVEELRATLNKTKRDDQPKLTLLPFLIKALVLAVRDEPVVNAIFDDEAGVVHQYGGVHVGMAVQTPTGLMVANVKHCEARDLWDTAAEVNRLADAARKGSITRDELRGSTITITSLGALGGLVHTPIINHPEVAIVGVNKMQIRPMWDGREFIPRQMMNLSSSFDHRIVDGWNAATFVQRIKQLLEEPALLFMEG
ncbi:2-oxo acid dehydrogenase subunit E2 [Tianweitania sp. BSSL-BM11]|uniref:Dihydrolipoamide acetyltransferase component of pyruvate dehydrogenase complex n=1 Tax=Tianweitania aestuarii TaxID=2814886 RepID=A0ABS5RWZ8_9HYPH|nr:dihydrolipoamide acetyltransferase family protein [Tianweitania aestuarii]MBS9721583.1 2-oxo acid dehydrogenase subunit E2 [Tianweitania aestuarii]